MADIFNNFLKKGIIKLDVSDHVPIFFSIKLTKEKLREGAITIKKEFLIAMSTSLLIFLANFAH